MTVAHKNLTGTDLHESKGASTATAGQVPIADGAGSAPFGKLTATSLQTTGNPFGAQLLHVREEQANGVSSTFSLTGAFTARTLNTTTTNEISGASLASNTITLPAGTYFINAKAVTNMTGSSGLPRSALRLYNTTGSALLLAGMALCGASNTTGNPTVESIATLSGRFTLGGTTNIQLQQFCTNQSVTGNGGVAISAGQTEVFADVLIWKVL